MAMNIFKRLLLSSSNNTPSLHTLFTHGNHLLSSLRKTPSIINTLPSLTNITKRTLILPANEVRLNNLRDNPGAKQQRTRVGRGIGSGKGKTCGRGHGGQKSRTGRGKPAPGFEGGQTPLYKKMRKFGFKNAAFKRTLFPLNLSKLQHYIEAGRIDPTQTITMKTLYDANILQKVPQGVKLLSSGRDRFTYPLDIEMTDCSALAREAVERVGGTVKLVYYNKLGMRALLKPEKFEILPRLARPTPKLMKKYPEWTDII
eukprot:TRINITY_DN13564_c0_g1_i1.p1 TRINITY_DN13564_c0_g1~~TRINITY_DN13564_c0_g1_i1.p1  ORF type:complete len:258 (+),score=53.68 TRINITY_DN13564_c0_g1_i1:913-1686(+)